MGKTNSAIPVEVSKHILFLKHVVSITSATSNKFEFGFPSDNAFAYFLIISFRGSLSV